MYQIIAPSLFQNRTCHLPGIGTLIITTNSAEIDFGNAAISSPFDTINFIREAEGEKIFNEFSAISELLKNNLKKQGSVKLTGIGEFQTLQSGEINFISIDPDPVFVLPIKIERVIRQDVPHAILVGDQQTTNVVMTEFYNDQPVKKDRWWIWAIALAIIAIGVFVVYFLNQKGYNLFGNANYF